MYFWSNKCSLDEHKELLIYHYGITRDVFALFIIHQLIWGFTVYIYIPLSLCTDWIMSKYVCVLQRRVCDYLLGQEAALHWALSTPGEIHYVTFSAARSPRQLALSAYAVLVWYMVFVFCIIRSRLQRGIMLHELWQSHKTADCGNVIL